MSIGYKILLQLNPVNFSPQEKQQFEIAGVEHDLISLFLSVCAIKKAIFPKGSKISRGWTEVRQPSPSVGRGAVGIFWDRTLLLHSHEHQDLKSCLTINCC